MIPWDRKLRVKRTQQVRMQQNNGQDVRCGKAAHVRKCEGMLKQEDLAALVIPMAWEKMPEVS
jgi:hypothetical protein